MHFVGIRIAQDFLKVVAAAGMGGEDETLGAEAIHAQFLLYLSEGEIDEFLETAGSTKSRKVVAGAAVRAGVVAAGEQKDGRPLTPGPWIFSGGIAEIEAAEGLDVAAEIQTARVLSGAALGVSVEVDYDVNGLRFGAQVVPYDDEVRPALAAVCGEERHAVHFEMSAFPGALTGGLGGGVLRDFALRIGRLRFCRWSGVRRGIGGCGVGWCGLGRCGFWRRACIGKAVICKGCCLRSRLRAARGGGAKCLNGSTIEAAIRGQPDRLLKEAYRAASGRPEYTGHRDAEAKRGQLRLNHADHVRIGSTADGRRHRGRLHERPQARPGAGSRRLSKRRSLAWKLTPGAWGRSAWRAALERRASRLREVRPRNCERDWGAGRPRNCERVRAGGRGGNDGRIRPDLLSSKSNSNASGSNGELFIFFSSQARANGVQCPNGLFNVRVRMPYGQHKTESRALRNCLNA